MEAKLLERVPGSQWLLFIHYQNNEILCPYSSLNIGLLLQDRPDYSKTTEGDEYISIKIWYWPIYLKHCAFLGSPPAQQNQA